MTPSDWEDGHRAGGVAARLEQHDAHLSKINGSMHDVANELRVLTLSIQRLADQAIARDATVISTAAALKEAEEVRRTRDDSAWTPTTRLISVIAIVATVISTLAAIYFGVANF